MAAASRTIGFGKLVWQVWAAVRQRIRCVVQECNCEAGERLWCVEEEVNRLRVWGKTRHSSSVDMSMDAVKGLLICQFSLPRGERWEFQVMGDGATLRRSAETYNVEQAVNLVLDGLVTA